MEVGSDQYLRRGWRLHPPAKRCALRRIGLWHTWLYNALVRRLRFPAFGNAGGRWCYTPNFPMRRFLRGHVHSACMGDPGFAIRDGWDMMFHHHSASSNYLLSLIGLAAASFGFVSARDSDPFVVMVANLAMDPVGDAIGDCGLEAIPSEP